MANDTAKTCPSHLVKSGFWPAHMDEGHIVYVGLADTKVFVKGELVKDDGSGGATNGAASTDIDAWMGIALEDAGSATAGANASTTMAIYVPTLYSEFFWAEANGTPSATHCGPIWDFADKNTVDIGTGAAEAEVGFKPYAYDATNNMVYGVFAVQAN